MISPLLGHVINTNDSISTSASFIAAKLGRILGKHALIFLPDMMTSSQLNHMTTVYVFTSISANPLTTQLHRKGDQHASALVLYELGMALLQHAIAVAIALLVRGLIELKIEP